MNAIKIFFVALWLLTAVGALFMWVHGIYAHESFEEKTYWMMLMFVMLWISDNAMEGKP